VQPVGLKECADSIKAATVYLLKANSAAGSKCLSNLLPLPAFIVDAMGHDVEELQLLQLSPEQLPTTEDAMRSFLHVTTLFLAGDSCIIAHVWLQISRLRACLQRLPASSGLRPWTDESTLTASCFAALMQLSRMSLHLDVSITDDIIGILCSFGPPNVHDMDHSLLPLYGGASGGITADLTRERVISRLGSLVFGSPSFSRLAVGVLRDLRSHSTGTISDDKPSVHDKLYTYFAPCRPSSGVSALALCLKDRYKGRLLPSKGLHASGCRDQCWSDKVWSVANCTYDTWICRVVSSLIADYYCKRGTFNKTTGFSMDNTSAMSKGEREDERVKKNAEWGLQVDSAFFSAFYPLARIDAVTAEMLFPLIVENLVEHHAPSARLKLETNLSTHVLAAHLIQNDGNEGAAKEDLQRAMRTCLKVITFLFRKDVSFFTEGGSVTLRPLEASKSSQNYEGSVSSSSSKGSSSGSIRNVDPRKRGTFKAPLGQDFLFLSKAALRCNCVCSALLFLELYLDLETPVSEDKQQQLKGVDGDWILLQIYCMLHDPDALLSIDIGQDLEMQAVVYTETGQWMEAIATYESLLHSPNTTAQRVRAREGIPIPSPHAGIAKALRGQGLQHVLHRYSAGHMAVQPDDGWGSEAWQGAAASGFDDLGRQSDSHLRQWSTDADVMEAMQQSVLSATLQDLGQQDVSAALKRLSVGQSDVYDTLATSCEFESGKRLISDLASMQKLFESKEVALLSSVEGSSAGVQGLLQLWSQRHSDSTSENEALLSHRLGLLRVMAETREVSSPSCMALLSQVGSSIHGKGSRAAHTMSRLLYQMRGLVLHRVDGNSSIMSAKWHLEEAKLQWEKGLKGTAMSTLQTHVITSLNNFDLDKTTMDDADDDAGDIDINRVRGNLLCEALVTAGRWAHAQRSLSSPDILSRYLQPASVEKDADVAVQTRAFATLADFNLEMYHSLERLVSSTEWAQQNRVIEQERLDLANSRANAGAGAPISGVEKNRLAEVKMKADERKRIQDSVQTYMVGALGSYSKVLARSTDADLDVVFKVISIWFKNCHVEAATRAFKDIVAHTESFKFIPLSYQIVSRLGASDQSVAFRNVLKSLVSTMCRNHPHHTLFMIIAATKGGDATPGLVKASEDMLNSLRALDANLADLINNTEEILAAYHDLAMMNIPRKSGTWPCTFGELTARANAHLKKGVKMSSTTFLSRVNAVLRKGRSTNQIPAMLTINHALRPDGDYSDIVRIGLPEDKVTLSESGLSAPKIFSMKGSDGSCHKQLMKGNDDVRQDAVMQQVLAHVSLMLSRNAHTRLRGLHIITYRVTPLTPQSGLMQFVGDTAALGEYLVADRPNKAAHKRYHPNDWSHKKCGLHMHEGHKSARMEDHFQEVCDNFRPVFRYFFLEKYPEPAQWVSRRLAYVRSAAATSMVGYILGIGDRHASNVLINEKTAELVHIDFGVTFDQGKLLRTPETVPFRLTRDMVDAMGVSGVEGTFRRSSEEVLQVLRDSTPELLTILEVVVYDPLYKWVTKSKQGTNREMNEVEDSASRRAKAELTLQQVKNKLQGFEENTGDCLSIQGSVQMLIQEATSFANLSKLYPGWAAWV
jgi:hypothetical protein